MFILVISYTSLGGRSSTIRNPALLVEGKDGGDSSHLPAFLLNDGDRERDGRVRSSAAS